MEWGAAFDRDAEGRPALGREAAHSVRRVLHARDATGREIGRVLWSRVAVIRSIRVFEDALALSLDLEDGACVGATFLDKDGVPSTLRARADARSPPAARAICFARPRIRSSRAATGWPWRSRRAREWPTSSSCSSTRRC